MKFYCYLDHFDDYKRLRGGVYFVDSFPSTLSGKLLRREIRQTAIKLYNERKNESEK